jgi:hypothetical protein
MPIDPEALFVQARRLLPMRRLYAFLVAGLILIAMVLWMVGFE